MSNQKIIGVDIGNSSIKTAEFFAKEIGEIRNWKSLVEIGLEYSDAHFIVSSVSVSKEEITSQLKSCLIVTSKVPLPISLNYDTPETLGSDRVAAAVGAWNLFPNTNLLIVDAGTCITYDLVTEDGVYQGGLITPGLNIRFQAMHQFTKALPLVESISPDDKPNFIGKSTIEGMSLGTTKGLEFEIQGVLASFNKKYDRLQVVMTGGLSFDFESISKAHIFASSKIVLGGLHAIWKFNEAN